MEIEDLKKYLSENENIVTELIDENDEKEIVLDNPIDIFQYLLIFDEPIKVNENEYQRKILGTIDGVNLKYSGYLTYSEDLCSLNGRSEFYVIQKINKDNIIKNSRYDSDIFYIDNKRNGRCVITQQQLDDNNLPIGELIYLDNGFYIEDELINKY